MQFLPKLDEEAGDVFIKSRVGVAIEQALDDAVVVGDDFVKGIHAKLTVVFTEVGQCFFEGIGRLAHGRDHQHDVLVLVLADNLCQIAHGIGIFYRRSTEFIDFANHILLFMPQK